MPEWAPNKRLPLAHENVEALAKRHRMPTDVMAIARLRETLTAALSHWEEQSRADQRATSIEVERQIAKAIAAAEKLARSIEALPEQIKMDLDDQLRDELPGTAVHNFFDLLKDSLPKAGASYLEGKRWLERLGYKPKSGRGSRGHGKAFRALAETLCDVWQKVDPNKRKVRASAYKGNDETLEFTQGGQFVRDAVVLLTRGEAPELEHAYLVKLLNPPVPKKSQEANSVRSNPGRKKDR